MKMLQDALDMNLVMFKLIGEDKDIFGRSL